jgi:CRP-like cAMP-binding protein
MPSMKNGHASNPREHWLLSGVPPELVDAVVGAGREERYLSGDIIFRQGDKASGLYLVMAGTARVTTTASNGDTLLTVVKANEVLGEMGVLDGEPRSGTATAASMCVAYVLPTEPVLDLLERSTLVCMRLLALLTRRLRATNARLADMPATWPIMLEEAVLPD